MPRSVCTILLVLVVAAGCAPAVAIEPAAAAPVGRVVETAARTPTSRPSAPSPTAPATTEAPRSEATLGDPEPRAATSVDPAPDRRDRVRATAGGFAVKVASVADFVPQYTFEWCVGASLQMARSIITDHRNESRRSQRRLWQMARDRSASPYGGASPVGWTATLNDLGLGPYRLVSVPTFNAALTTAARALAQTKRPVGLVMWAGRHAWVMTGFEATGNPRRDPDARVTRIRVMDPLYPHGSRWGKSPAPNTLIGRRKLKRQFVVRIRPDYPLGVAPGWLLVLPVR
jgi:hypothetical protein